MFGTTDVLLKVVVGLIALIVALLPTYQGAPGGDDLIGTDDTITTVPVPAPTTQPGPTVAPTPSAPPTVAPPTTAPPTTAPPTAAPLPLPAPTPCPTTPTAAPTTEPTEDPTEDPAEDDNNGGDEQGEEGDGGEGAMDEGDQEGEEEGDGEEGGETAPPTPSTTPTTAPTTAPTGPSICTPTTPTPGDPTAPAPPAPGTPGTPNPGQTVPVGNTEVFKGDYDTGDFSQWGTCQSVDLNSDCGANYPSMEIVNDGPGHETAAHFIVNSGDVPDFGGGERSEVRDSGAADVSEGDEHFYEFSLKVGQEFPEPEGWGLILMQWHPGGGSPVMTLSAEGGNLVIGGHERESHPIGPLPTGEWKNYVLHIKFSKDAGSGFVAAWENGVQTVQQTPYAALAGDAPHYLKQGIYRDNQGATHEAWWDGLRITAP